jgi:hypothetical protein
MTEQRLTEQLRLVFTVAEDVQSSAAGGDAESVVAEREPERPAVISSMMEAVCERENLKKALRRVKANKGSLDLIRFGGHLSCGGYDVQTDGRHTKAATAASPVY